MTFNPQYHVKNSQGSWQMKPFDPKFAAEAAKEAQQLSAAGEVLAPVVDEGAPFVPRWSSGHPGDVVSTAAQDVPAVMNAMRESRKHKAASKPETRPVATGLLANLLRRL